MRYPVIIEKDGSGFKASFPDIPEALTGADTYAETLNAAQDALVTAFEFYLEDNRLVPLPSASVATDYIDVPLSVSAKVMLLNELVQSNVTRAELARRMGLTPQTVNRIVDINHATKIDTVAQAFTALGKRLQLTVE